MSGSSPPPDNSLAVEQQREQAQREQQAIQDQKDLQHKNDLAALRGTARSGATGSVNNYFSSKGLDPTAYGGSIEQQLNDISTGISPTDENPGSAYSGAGQTIWDNLTNAARSKASTSLNSTFDPNYSKNKAPMSLDDTYWTGLEADQYNDADKIIRNMLDRGVLTQSGYAAASKDLTGQRAGVRSRLDDSGNKLIGEEQSSLDSIINNARSTASNLNLGDKFDPGQFVTQADDQFNTFLSGLSDKIRAANPGSLYTTAGLAAIGGAGQGLGNTAFNPGVAGGSDDPNADTSAVDDPNKNANSIF
jgi:hypothetical protein